MLRRVRAFKRWMRSQGLEYSDVLDFKDDPEQGISVIALGDLKEGDLVATIPKSACLTVKTSGASDIIESAGLGGSLGLAFALMYEKSLGEDSPWAGYLQLLPHQECVPCVWSLEEVDSLLSGTELHEIVKEDRGLIFEDWKQNILPLLDLNSANVKLNPDYFGVEHYFAAKSLVASRSFQIDDFHGSGMVPLADLCQLAKCLTVQINKIGFSSMWCHSFNHKTGAEDVHFTSVSSHCQSDSDADNDDHVVANSDDNEPSTEHPHGDGEEFSAPSNGKSPLGGSDLESSALEDVPTVLQMIMVKDVRAGAEVFNTYGLIGNAALLHRYGFTEPDNQFDIVNIDMELVLKWSSSLFSSRYIRARLSLWRKLGYSACQSQNSEYFELTSDGMPQIELLILLYIMLLTENVYHKLDLKLSTMESYDEALCIILSEKNNIQLGKGSEMSEEQLLTESVCNAISSLADMRESLYPSNSKEDDIELLRSCSIRDRKLYHSLSLRVSERKILEKLRTYAATHMLSIRNAKRGPTGKRLKRNGLQHSFL
ncbi:hypothetical protein WN944_021586 [Citrus x changshan-huyou]|uniref:N-lysine methyltransferase n=1 Tax=Citrus x changshan-huyou TaxID=2935761 RepID=A0AAP0MX31_9ROSI